MAKTKKSSRNGSKPGSPRDDNPGDHDARDDAGEPLSDFEVEISLVCLRYFRGDWDMYLDYLQGPRVVPEQRMREIPLVESLRDRDRRTEYLTTFLEDDVVAIAQRLEFDNLLKIWEHSLELDPQSEPFPEFRGEAAADDRTAVEGQAPPTMH